MKSGISDSTVHDVRGVTQADNGRDGVSNHQPHDCLLGRLFIQAQSKENIEAPRHWLLCGKFTGDLPAQLTSNITWKMFPFDDVITNVHNTDGRVPLCTNEHYVYGILFRWGK